MASTLEMPINFIGRAKLPALGDGNRRADARVRTRSQPDRDGANFSALDVCLRQHLFNHAKRLRAAAPGFSSFRQHHAVARHGHAPLL